MNLRVQWPIFAVFGLVLCSPSLAQLTAPVDVVASAPIVLPDGSPLPGTHPDSHRFGIAPVPGGLVQLIDCGPNGLADWPRADGQPGGDDLLIASRHIGEGMAPNRPETGRFAFSVLHPVLPPGRRLFIRVYDAPDTAQATRWGQSAVTTHQNSRVIDASQLSLRQLGQLRLEGDPSQRDSDGDGASDFDEAVANTRADQARDVLRLPPHDPASFTLQGQAGRRYRLERSETLLGTDADWQTVDATGFLEFPAPVELSDPAPQTDVSFFYRLGVESRDLTAP